MMGHPVIEEDDIEIRPWWQNPVNFVAIAIAALILGSGIGYWAGDSAATPNFNKVDVGFLQDMRYHHDQAVQMAYFYLTSVDEPQPRLTLLAEEILLSQQLESGRIVQLLRSFGASEANDTGEGVDISRIFATLMIEHHRGGVAMAEFAVENAANDDVRSMAQSMITGQSAEITEMQNVLDSL